MGLKRLVQKTAYHSGWTALRGRRRHERCGGVTLEIFYGHHVLDAGAQVPDLKAHQLRERLQYLRRTRDLVTLQEGVEALEQARGHQRLAALTFDDGYRDNLQALLPILRETQTPATVYVNTEPIVERCGLWVDRVRTALRLSRLTALDLPWLDESLSDNISLTYIAMERLRRVGPGERRQRLEDLLAAVPAECRTLLAHQKMLSQPELQELAADPLISIGAHTHTHSVLSACTTAEVEEELASNVESLQEITGQRPLGFAYPNGQPLDFTPRDCAILTSFGLTPAVTTVRGVNMPGDDPLRLKRLPLGEGAADRFAWQTDASGKT